MVLQPIRQQMVDGLSDGIIRYNRWQTKLGYEVSAWMGEAIAARGEKPYEEPSTRCRSDSASSSAETVDVRIRRWQY